MFQRLFQPRPQTGAPVATIDVAGLKRRIDSGERLVLLDVRSHEEYAHDGHIAGSRLLPLPMLAMRVDELPKDTPIICVCRSGNRSQVAAELLAGRGFTSLFNLTGGMVAWRRANLPTQFN